MLVKKHRRDLSNPEPHLHPSRQPLVYNQTYETRNLNPREPSWETDLEPKSPKLTNGDSRIEVFSIVNKRRNYPKERKPRVEKPRTTRSDKGVRRCILRRGTSGISKQIPINDEWATHYVVLPTTEYHSTDHNRGRIYSHFGSRKGCTMVTSVYGGTIDNFQPNHLHWQRSGIETYQNTDVSPEVSAHRTQTPLYQRISGSEVSASQRNTRQREPCRHNDENYTNEFCEGVEEQDVLDTLMKEWINEE